MECRVGCHCHEVKLGRARCRELSGQVASVDLARAGGMPASLFATRYGIEPFVDRRVLTLCPTVIGEC